MLSAPPPRAGPPWPQVVGSGELISSRSWGSRGPGSTWELRVLCRHRFYSACHFLDVALGKLMKITQQEGATAREPSLAAAADTQCSALGTLARDSWEPAGHSHGSDPAEGLGGHAGTTTTVRTAHARHHGKHAERG